MNGPLKLVISGPVGAGKTTFIHSLSDIDVVNTDELSTENIGKAKTTVAMDYGKLRLDGIQINLFGTPGQDRFDFMWDVLCEGALGLVVLVAGDAPETFPHARKILEFITSRISVPFIIGVTRQDLPRVWGPEDVCDYFQVDDDQVIGVNALQRNSSVGVMKQLLELIDSRLELAEGSTVN
jgi:uncharacterized protein